MSAGRLPLADAVRPPAEVGIRVRARVEVLGVGPVQADVDGRRGRTQHARQPCAAHHAVGGAVALKQREDVVGEPRAVSELDHRPCPRRQAFEEPVETRVVALHRGRQLQQQRPAASAQLVQAATDPLDPLLRRAQAPRVCEAAWTLDRQLEPLGQPPAPRREPRRRRPAVEARVELDRVELGLVDGQPPTGRQAGRVEHVRPVVVAPARCADPRHAGPAHPRGDRSGSSRMPNRSRSAQRAACQPLRPCTPGPGVVDAEQR